jgi:hypothetical protein
MFAKPLILSLALLGGCTILEPAQLPGPAAVTPVQKAQASINEANLLITAAAHTLEANRKDGIISEAEYWELGTQLVAYAKDVDHAQAALRGGEAGAEGQAEMLKVLIVQLHKQIAAKARKQ